MLSNTVSSVVAGISLSILETWPQSGVATGRQLVAHTQRRCCPAVIPTSGASRVTSSLILICLGAFCALIWLLRRNGISLGLPVAYLYSLMLIHLPGAFATVVGRDLFLNS